MIKIKLSIMNFLEFAVWGSYLTSMGAFLAANGQAAHIGWFYAVQGLVSLFMPALIGILADRWIPAQKMLSLCQLIAAVSMGAAGWYGLSAGSEIEFVPLFIPYTISVAFFMPTIGLANSVAYTALGNAGLDTVKHFPPIRVFGTIGFICAMLAINFVGLQNSAAQLLVSAAVSVVLCIYALSMPNCPVNKSKESKSLADALGLKAFALFKDYRMAIFFIFSMLLGVSLQITNGFANPFIQSFGQLPEFANTFGVKNANALISISQMSETLCILLIPFFLRKFGIKIVMLMAMFAWVFRFGFFGIGNPGSGVGFFIASMIVYGIAFDFFNVSGSLYVDQQTNPEIRSSAQGLFMIMTNGIGATIGTLAAQAIVNKLVYNPALTVQQQIQGWSTSWYIFASYALVVGILFAIIFKNKKKPNISLHQATDIDGGEPSGFVYNPENDNTLTTK